MKKRTIAILTDFGYKDPYVSIMKAVIMGRCSNAKFIDISHDIPSFDIVSASYVLYNSFSWFPLGTVFLVVVDPGVGSERKPLAIKTKKYYFVGPDNGVLYESAIKDGIEEVRIIENRELMMKQISSTFHGRDVFAPVAAWIACNNDFKSIGRRTDNIKKVELIKYNMVNPNTLCAKAIYVDKFGNIALSVRNKDLNYPSFLKPGGNIIVNNAMRGKIGKTFSDVGENELVVYVNSFGFIELAINRGSASRLLDISVGDDICIRRVT